MTQRQAHIGIITSLGIAFGVLAIATASVMAGDLRVQAAGLDVTLSSKAERGFVIKIDGADCPGAGCPAFALNWSLAKRG
ncbi:MAG: hypothetical protein CMK07_05890 [Ponticaulis sp.]|nr:hypothetical protein [Ponticaulis sp.]|tara:strand:- start:168 stop:407 length:240 start_codon:yes stop_codon:yes gene_type:complete